MTESSQSAAAIVEEWLRRAESAAASIPSWLPSAHRGGAADAIAVPRETIHAAIDRASSAPPAQGPLSSRVSCVSEPRISVRPDERDQPPYPDLREENLALKKQVAEMAVSMARLRAEVLEASEQELVGLACAIAERVIGHELRADPSLAVAWARESIDALGSHDDVVIAVGPDLAAIFGPTDWMKLTGRACRVETDPSLGPLVCEVRSRSSVVDASAQGRLGALARELGVGGT